MVYNFQHKRYLAEHLQDGSGSRATKENKDYKEKLLLSLCSVERKCFRYPPQAAANYILSAQGYVKIKMKRHGTT